MKYFPVFFDLDGRKVVIAGGGESAVQKLRLLLKTSAKVIVIAEKISDEISGHGAAGHIAVVQRAPIAADLSGAVLAYAASGCPRADAAFAAMARSAGTPVNAVDQPAISDFITPALVDRDPVTVAIGTEGTAPVLARSIKAEIEALLPASTGAIARLAASWREKLATRIPEPMARRRLWQRFFAQPLPVSEGPAMLGAAEIRLQALVSAALSLGEGRGAVSRIAVGDGGQANLSRSDRALLHDADVIVHDFAVNRRVLELARREAKFIAVEPSGNSTTTPRIHEPSIDKILTTEAATGQRVVYLVGGPGPLGRPVDRATSNLEKETL